jgi:hypothetical protein
MIMQLVRYNAIEDEVFMLDITLSSFCWQRRGLPEATGGYVTGRLKRLAEFQAAGLAETHLATIAEYGAHKLVPTGNQTRPSWLLRLGSG